jgi:crotonobetainyl-CoA:carnitine CoA-transferase CaiB-like acyl-CoA transferase
MDTAPANRTGPLAGYRILDLTAVVLGPLATQILGDYGADIIKVEPPAGDLMRANGVSKHRGMSSIFLAINRNKRSLSIDLKSPEGLAIIHRLLPSVDVVVHNMRVDAIERLGLGYAALSALKPDLVYCMATGFGESGPDAGKPAFDDVIQAASGIASLIGNESGKPDYAPTLLADKTCGLALANAVLAALLHRERTGQGQLVEVPMLETMVAFTMAEHLGGLSFEPPIGPAGYVRLLAGGRKPAPTRDGHIAMLPYTAAHWVAFFKGVGRDDLAARYDLEDRHERNAKIRQIYADMASVTSQMSTDECLALCERLDIPATRIYSINELPDHPHLKAVGLFESVDHPSEGPIRSVRPSTLFERSPAQISIHAPLLGQHTDEMMREAGFDDEAIDRLEAQGIINRGRADRP